MDGIKKWFDRNSRRHIGCQKPVKEGGVGREKSRDSFSRMQQEWQQHADSPNTVISGSFLMRPNDGCGLSQTTEECMRNSPIEISVT